MWVVIGWGLIRGIMNLQGPVLSGDAMSGIFLVFQLVVLHARRIMYCIMTR